MANYFNTLNLRQQLAQLGKCRFMQREEFADGCNVLKGKKVVIVGCGAQGLNQGLNMRDSGLDISYALRKAAITEKRASWQKATDNGFVVGTAVSRKRTPVTSVTCCRMLRTATCWLALKDAVRPSACALTGRLRVKV